MCARAAFPVVQPHLREPFANRPQKANIPRDALLHRARGRRHLGSLDGRCRRRVTQAGAHVALLLMSRFIVLAAPLKVLFASWSVLDKT